MEDLNIKSGPTIVCLCGSTRFYEAFQKANYDETMAGRIVLSVGFYPHSLEQAHGEKLGATDEQKRKLDALHLRKIDISDEVLVLNVDGYVGESTGKEIRYAAKAGKRIRWLEKKIPIQFQKMRLFPDAVHEEDGKWYFWEETWAHRQGPFDTENEARREIKRYSRWLNHGPDED